MSKIHGSHPTHKPTRTKKPLAAKKSSPHATPGGTRAKTSSKDTVSLSAETRETRNDGAADKPRKAPSLFSRLGQLLEDLKQPKPEGGRWRLVVPGLAASE